MTLDEMKFHYPEVYLFANYDDKVFLERLLQSNEIDPEDYASAMIGIGEAPTLPAELGTEERNVIKRLGFALWSKIADFSSVLFRNVWTALIALFPIFYKTHEDYVGGWIKRRLDEFYKYYIPDLTKTEDYPPALVAEIEQYKRRPTLSSLILLFAYGVGQKLFYISALLPAIQNRKVREINKEYEPNIPDIATLVRQFYKTPADRDKVLEKAAEQGFSKEDVNIYLDAFRPLFSVDELRSQYLRKILDDDTLSNELHRAGWDDPSIEKLKALFWLVPGPTDLVRFSVRETYYPDYVEKYGTDLEYPIDFEEDAKKTGVSPYWAHHYWRAHWVLPSIMNGFEMLHRGVITKDELADLFKAADVMPYWREKLEAISYRVLTRVDVRRMYDVGVLDRTGVKRSYLDLGYNEADAEKMTEFTIRFVSDKERDLTRADILGAYQRRLFSLDEAMSGLQALGYDPKEADLMVSRVDYDMEKKKKASILKNLERGYKRGAYTSDHIQARMGQMNMSGTEITELLYLWDTEKKDDVRSLTKADLDALYKKRVIRQPEYEEEMGKLGFQKRDIDWLIRLHKT